MRNKPIRKQLQLQTRAVVALSAIVFFITAGTISFHSLEEWTWIQSFYFTVVSLTTVGYGDLHPTTDATRLFTAIFILLGVTVVVSSISFVGSGYLQKRADFREARLGSKKN
jgi:hypothetical protein